MGETIKKLSQASIKARGVFPRRAVMESCETLHFHYRWLRLEMHKEEFKDILALFEESSKRYSELGEPEVSFHEELSKKTLPNYVDRKIDVELCKNLYKTSSNTGGKDSEFFIDNSYIHIHWDNVRLEMSIDEFAVVAETFHSAYLQIKDLMPLDLDSIFKRMDSLYSYVVIRNYDYLPDSVEVGEHSDLDILIDETQKERFLKEFKLEKVHPLDNKRVQYKLPIIDVHGNFNFIYVDVRTDHDNYFPHSLSRKMLDNRIKLKSFYVPSQEDHAMGLIYHGVYHKGYFKDDYVEKLVAYTNEPVLRGLIKGKDIIGLSKYLKSKQINFVKPYDYSVFTEENIQRILTKQFVFYKKAMTLKKRTAFIKSIPIIGNLTVKAYRSLRNFYVKQKQ